MSSTLPGRAIAQDYSFTLNGAAQSPLAVAYPAASPAGQYPSYAGRTPGSNPYRTFLFMQAPANFPITYSFTNASPNDPASTLAAGCFLLYAGQTFSTLEDRVQTGPLYINGGAAANAQPMTLQEC